MIKYENIEIKYGDFVAIDNLNLDIREGEFFTFLGPSGCGKTTSLRALVGFLTPSKGKVYVGDKDVTNLPVEKRNIGMVFQSYALFPTMTVYDNIAFGMKVKKLTREEIDRKVHEVAAKIKITEEQLRKNVADLSGGQQQRVALARAIVLEPKILCLDEPLSNLDAKLRIDMRMELKRLQKELGITTLYVTHDQEEALTLSDRIAVFNRLEPLMRSITNQKVNLYVISSGISTVCRRSFWKRSTASLQESLIPGKPDLCGLSGVSENPKRVMPILPDWLKKQSSMVC